MSSDVDRSRKSSSILRHSKRVRIHEDVKMSKINLSSLSPVGTSRTEGTVESHEASEPHIASKNFSQMASVLEGFNTKLKSHTSKKSLEILSSALEKIRLQLQAADSRIQADIGKLTSVGKSKRKRLESSFQEKHERLRLLHDKFKEEVNQQLLDYRTTLEELEAYQLELKGTAERLKASHRKLLLQAEDAVKVQISNADTCVLDFSKNSATQSFRDGMRVFHPNFHRERDTGNTKQVSCLPRDGDICVNEQESGATCYTRMPPSEVNPSTLNQNGS